METIKQIYTFNPDTGMVSIEILKNDSTIFSVSDSEQSEDNNLSRNFSDCEKVMKLMQEAYELGKSGEEVKFEEENIGI